MWKRFVTPPVAVELFAAPDSAVAAAATTRSAQRQRERPTDRDGHVAEKRKAGVRQPFDYSQGLYH
jgi:Ni/Co efflux regulator RcnB